MINSELETCVWRLAVANYGGGLTQVVSDAVRSFRRLPGLDDRDQLHVSEITQQGFQALQSALKASGSVDRGFGLDAGGSIMIRRRLRIHVRRLLQWRLMQDGKATDEMVADYLAVDVGL